MYENCVIGSLPSDVSDELATLMDAKKLKYTAKVLKLVPLSKRNAHAKSPIVIIGIEAKLAK